MSYGNLLIRDARIATPIGPKAIKGKEMGQLKIIENGYILIENGKIVSVDGMDNFPDSINPACEVIYAEGKICLPGFVDSHTHLVFGGFRPEEFNWRLRGESYMSIMERGGGIQSTVNATRQTQPFELAHKAEWFIRRMNEAGVTTVEAKSGYGLDFATEEKMLYVINWLKSENKDNIRIISTYLGAHAVPAEYASRKEEYIDFMIGTALPAFKDQAEFCDIFCEKNVFEIEESRRLLEAARNLGYKLKLHADEIVQLGGAELSADLKAVSADHLLHVSDEGIRRMAEEEVVATLLPLTAFALKEPYAPARKFIDSGVAVALATDLNPGSCFSGSIPLTIALACIYMNMSIEETITALTLNGAAALDLAKETGSIEPGKSGDIIMLDTDTYHILPYYVGMNCVKRTIFKGNIIVENP